MQHSFVMYFMTFFCAVLSVFYGSYDLCELALLDLPKYLKYYQKSIVSVKIHWFVYVY